MASLWGRSRSRSYSLGSGQGAPLLYRGRRLWRAQLSLTSKKNTPGRTRQNAITVHSKKRKKIHMGVSPLSQIEVNPLVRETSKKDVLQGYRWTCMMGVNPHTPSNRAVPFYCAVPR